MHANSTVILAGDTALRAIRWERRVHGALTWKDVDEAEQRDALARSTCLATRIDLGDLERIGVIDDGERLDVVVGPKAKRAPSLHVGVRQATSLGAYGVMRMRNGLYTLSPAALICDLASKLTFSELLAVIEELTGSWSLPERPAPEIDSTSIDFIGKPCGCYECAPAATIDDMLQYHINSKWVRGREAARRVITSATGSSRSPMEAITNCMFSLPHSLGGLNCGPLKPNYKIVLTSSAQMLSSLPYVVADAYLPRFKAIIEYNGSYHDDMSIRRRDEARALGLMTMGIDVYRINSLQLKDAYALESIARAIYRRGNALFHPRAKQYALRLPMLLGELRQALGLNEQGV